MHHWLREWTGQIYIERERETDRQTDRQTKTQRDREREKEKEKEKEREREREREREPKSRHNSCQKFVHYEQMYCPNHLKILPPPINIIH